jgi:hypothetical protein
MPETTSIGLKFEPTARPELAPPESLLLDIGVRAGGQYAVLFGDEPGPGGDPREMVIRGSKAEGIEGWLEAIGAADAGFLSVVADITSAADAGASVVESLVGMAGGNLYSIVVIPGESRDPATHYFSSAALSKLLRASRLSVAVDEVLADDFRAAVLDRGRRVDRGHLLETLRGALLALRGAHADWLEYPPGSRRILIPSVLYNSDREVFGRAENALAVLDRFPLLRRNPGAIFYVLAVGRSWSPEELQSAMLSRLKQSRPNSVYFRAISGEDLPDALVLFESIGALPCGYRYLLDESAKFASLTGHGGLPELRDLMEACR